MISIGWVGDEGVPACKVGVAGIATGSFDMEVAGIVVGVGVQAASRKIRKIVDRCLFISDYVT